MLLKNIKLQNISKWNSKKTKQATILFRGHALKKKNDIILNELSLIKNKKSFAEYANKLDGNFAIIIAKGKFIYAATDRIRSFPLLYYKRGNAFFISDNYRELKKLSINQSVDKKQIFLFSLSGYTLSNNTIFKFVKQIPTGTVLTFNRKEISFTKYYDWSIKIDKKRKDYKTKLKQVNEKVINNLIKSCNNRPIVVPLSAGFDSRFIISGLKEYGYKKLITFSYGRISNREAKVAKKISDKLKVPWYFIPYTNSKLNKEIQTKEFSRYLDYSDNLTSIHFPQDYYAIKQLKKNKLIPKDSIIVNGQTGDFISGNHIPKMNFKSKKIVNNIINYYVYKHHNLWHNYYFQKQPILEKIIHEKFSDSAKLFKNNNLLYRFYEMLEFQNRQVKYVINGQRLYDFFDYDWRLPMWDKAYLDFWMSAPLKYKINQNLYKHILQKTNWGNVWKDIPINPKPSFSVSISLIRFIFKVFFASLGKKKWHNFENKYLSYFTDPLCGFAEWKYFNIIRDKKGFRNSLSWQTNSYLKKKNINWEQIVRNFELD